MKQLIFLLLLYFTTSVVNAQHLPINEDIFGNLTYSSRDGKYSAKFERDIFDNLIFTDSRDNKLHFEKKYLMSAYPGILSDKNIQSGMFMGLTHENRRRSSYSAKFSIDIFDDLIIEDNQGYKLKRGVDIFGNEQIEEENAGKRSSFGKNLNGGLAYTSGKDKASLTKDILDCWTYKDSFGNEIQFGKQTWTRIMRRYESEESVFNHLLDDYFYP